MAKEQFNLKSMPKAEREAHKDSFFRLYRQLKCVKKAAEQAGISLKTATTWVKDFKANSNKIRRESKRGPQPGTNRMLTEEQVKQLYNMLVDHDPQQYKLPFALWTTKAVKELIYEKFGITMARRTVCLYMSRMGLTPQRPEKRAREQDEKKVKDWQERRFPAISSTVNKLGYTIFWGDETGISTRETFMRGYAPRGKTPVIDVTSVYSCRVNMISAVSNRGDLYFKLYSGAMTSLKYIRFLNALCKEIQKTVVLVVDNLKVHHSRLVKRWLKKHSAKIHVFIYLHIRPNLILMNWLTPI